MTILTMTTAQFQFLIREFSKLQLDRSEPVQIIEANDGSVSIMDCKDLVSK